MARLNRWSYVGVGVIVLLFAGLVYAWSVLSQPIAVEFADASAGELSLTFTICMIFFCLGGFVGGLLQRWVSVRTNVIVASGLFLSGFLIAAQATSLMGLYFGYGVLAGLASGLSYNAVMSTMSRWFPDRQGLVSGILLMGFGIGSFVIGKVFQALTPAEVGGWRSSFVAMAWILCLVCLVGSAFFVLPPEGWAPPAVSSSVNRDRTASPSVPALQLAPGQMVRTTSFWLFFVWAILLSAAGLAVISQASGMVGQVTAGSLKGSTTATLVGLISIFNGVGRVLFGGLFDRAGQRVTMLAVDGAFLFSMLVVIAALVSSSLVLLVAGFVCCGLSYGGITPTNSAFINAFYGDRNYPVNFSIVNLNLVVASFGGTLAGVAFDATGSYVGVFLALLGVTCVAAVCTLLIRRP